MQGRFLSTVILFLKKCNIRDTFGRRQTDSGHVSQSPYPSVFQKGANGLKLFPSDAQEILFFTETDQDFLNITWGQFKTISTFVKNGQIGGVGDISTICLSPPKCVRDIAFFETQN